MRWLDDDTQQKCVRDLVIGPGLYGRFAADGRYVYIDKGRLATTLQKRFAVDTIVQGTGGKAVCVEEKIVRWPGYDYTALTLETMSCTVPGRESDGWMKYGQADMLNYAMCRENGDVVCHLIDFQKLQATFWPAVDGFRETITGQSNRTACRIVPLDWVREHVGIKSFPIYATPDGQEAVKAFNASHYMRHKTATPAPPPSGQEAA